MRNGWRELDVGDILQLEYGKPLDESYRQADGRFPVYGANGEKDRTDKFYCEKPSIIVGRKGSAGEINLTEERFWPLDVTYFVTFDEKKYDLRFLYYLLTSLYLPRLAKGVKPGINRNEVYSQVATVPGLPEQRRIVGLLDGAFEGIATAKATAEKNLQNARALFRTGFVAFATPPESKSWNRTTVANLADSKKGSIRTGPFGSQLLHSEFASQGIAVLGIDNAVANKFRWAKSRFITPQKYRQLMRYRVHSGDVLITIMGTCGRCAVVPDDIPVAINTKHLCCITLDPKRCLPGYLHAFFLYHPLAEGYLAKHAKGAIMAGLNMRIIREMPVVVPSVEKQNEIVSALASLSQNTQRLESIYQQKLVALQSLKKSMLHQAFTGQL